MSAAPRERKTPVSVPDVSGLTLIDAALAYAHAGLAILPINDPKNPGSIVGKGWPQQSTKDVDVVEYFWDLNPDAGIAIHTGKSGLVAFDLDIDVIPAELNWLKEGLFQHTRLGGERGHYVFASDETFISGKLALADGTTVGEVRSGNTVIIAEPSPHAKADAGGLYHWTTTGVVPALPQIARQYVRVLGTAKAGVWKNGFEATDELVLEALKDWADNSRPKALAGQVNKIRSAHTGTRDTTRDVLRVVAGEARIGFYPLTTAVESVREAMIASYEKRGEDKFSDVEFGRLVKNGVGYALSRRPQEITDEANRNYGENSSDTKDSEPIFRQFGPTQWAQPVPNTEFLIKRVLATDTWGVNSGPKKSLKTHDNQAIGLAVATGINLYNDARFAVEQPGKVVYIVGEGGQHQVRRVLHRMLRAYGIKPDQVANDPDFPFVVYFGAAPLNSKSLRDEIRAILDYHQPALVLMESFYNFHPRDVNAANLYERGQLIDSYHKLVCRGSGVVSLLTDHHKKSASGTDLDQISMSGQGENVDSWIIRDHRKAPDVQTGDFCLTTSFNGRDWGGNVFDVDWHLGPFDHDAGAHTGEISWTIADHKQTGATTHTGALIRQMVIADVSQNPFSYTRSEIQSRIKARREEVIKEIRVLVDSYQLVEEPAKDHGRTDTKAKVLGPAPPVLSISKLRQRSTGKQP
ncbi:bifunctional DNA primase/polymerase [Mycobacterium paraintracellulare]|uniref:bifunctional DNA primase/polymerase n=1 Tax=Mycobacterium paraintracellulare TaxID=1138383 RepID=UPI0019259837|nr:bifunctional DNA primase/polymerase [Mycobacterium paraintracellulare]BCP05627.1 hypothetical protein MINTM019_30830 [Mycobacterium paraintracellulare]